MLDYHLPKKNCFLCFNESSLKMMKNSFYFILKTRFVLKILLLLFYPDFLVMSKAALLER